MRENSGTSPFKITICGIDELVDHSDAKVTHVLSILDPATPEPDAFGAYGEHAKLELRFHDVIEANVPGYDSPQPHHIEALLEFGRERFEQLDVFGFLAGKMQECSGAVVVDIQLRAHMVEHERQNEFLDQAECIEIAVTSYLVEQDLFLARQKVQRVQPGQRFGKKWPREVQALVSADKVFDSPVGFL